MTSFGLSLRGRVRGLPLRLKKLRAVRPVNRYNARTHDEAATALVSACAEHSSRPGGIHIVGGPSSFRDLVASRLAASGVAITVHEVSAVANGALTPLAGVRCIVLAADDSATQFAVAKRLIDDPATAGVPLEYVALPQQENAPIARWDRLSSADFVSPLLIRHGSALFDIYAAGLQRFWQKTEIRDFLDLCQSLESVHVRGIGGNVAEFGSFHGHSGWLMSRVLEHLGSDATLYMFDMFENFPDEELGVDAFWSGTHAVNFDEVRSKFSDRSNVEFVKGDFTRTLAETDTGTLALAFVDCDSYRATQNLLPQIWNERLAEGGVVVLEDYGHAALLGNRIAVHEFFDDRRDAFTYFSQFSGLFVAIKLAQP